MQGGARNQNQVTAWLAAKMLAERPDQINADLLVFIKS